MLHVCTNNKHTKDEIKEFEKLDWIYIKPIENCHITAWYIKNQVHVDFLMYGDDDYPDGFMEWYKESYGIDWEFVRD